MLQRIFLVFALCLVCAACSSSGGGEEKLNGKWSVDMQAMIAEMTKGEQNEQAKQMAEMMAQQMAGSIQFEFDVKNKELRAVFGGRSEGGKYTVVSDDGKTVKLKTDDGEATIQFNGDDDITLTVPGQKESVALKRAK